MTVKYYCIDSIKTPNQQICSEGRFSLYRNLLKMFGELSFHELARKVLDYKEYNNEQMASEQELGYCLLRLLEEGLIGMKNAGPCKNTCCSVSNIDLEDLFGDTYE